ncbi:Zinc/iron permease, partial [Ramicandelaber brevisporus]
VLHFGKLFGAGVILGTGFIHMLPAAFSALSNKCLPRLFTEQYTAFTPLIAMMAGLAIHLLEWMAVSHYANIQSEHRELCHGENDDIQLEQQQPPSRQHTSSTSSDSAVHHAHAHAHLHAAHLQNIRSRRVSAIILEVGISLHSVLIGIALGVATGTEFRVLALAIAIHQSFEGMALGASITAAEFDTLRTSLLGALLFSLTTPLGVCIGVAIHKLYNENSPAALITQGVMDSVSAGILIYMAYVGLIAEEFSSKPFRKLSRAMKVASFASLYFGAIAMALLGIWA